LHFKNHIISGDYQEYWVEISHTRTEALIVLLPLQNHRHREVSALVKKMPLKVADELLRLDKNDAATFVRRIKLKNG
jgi:hypothetical protein